MSRQRFDPSFTLDDNGSQQTDLTAREPTTGAQQRAEGRDASQFAHRKALCDDDNASIYMSEWREGTLPYDDICRLAKHVHACESCKILLAWIIAHDRLSERFIEHSRRRLGSRMPKA
jgi:hypothetical protein